MKEKLLVLLKVLVTASLMALLFRRVDFAEFWAVLHNAKVDLLVASMMVLWAGHYMCIIRWRILMRPIMPVLSLSQLFGIYCIGLFFNLAFPTVVGGDVVKIYYAGKPSKRFGPSFAATFLDRDAGMLAMMIIACIASSLYPENVPGVPVTLIVWSGFAGFLMVNVAIFASTFHQMTQQLLKGLNLGRLAAKADALSAAFQVMAREKRVLVVSLVISLVNQLVVIAVTWLMARALGIQVSFYHFMIFVPVVTLISMIPITLNGMGLREYAFVSLFTAIGIDREAATALGLLSSFVLILSAIPGGIIYVVFRSRDEALEVAALKADL